MFDRFTDDAKRLMALSRQHALQLRHGAIAPEHMLLALLQLPHSSAGRHLEAWGLDPKLLAPHLEAELEPGTALVDGNLPFTPAARKVLQLALEEALTVPLVDELSVCAFRAGVQGVKYNFNAYPMLGDATLRK